MNTQTIDIVRAASQSSVYYAALAYERMGFSVLACKRDKSPALRQWKHLQARRTNRETIGLWDMTGLLQSVGIICGQVSGNLVVIDCDGQDAVTTFARAFPMLTKTYTVVSGSGKGAHFYLYVDQCPPTTRTVGQAFGNIEMRSNGAYVIAPPSLHPSGQRYSVNNPCEILRVDNLHALRQWIESLIREKHGGIMPPPANGKVWNATPYARAALESECRRVALTATGRNNALNAAAFRMGRFVRNAQISRMEVESALTAAAAHLAQDDGETSVIKTIKSGLDAGIAKYGVRS